MTREAQAIRERGYRLINWNVHVEIVRKVLESARDAAKARGFFESLYVSSAPGERQIQLFAGTHPIGRLEIKTDELGRVLEKKLATESGAALVFSQSESGHVAIILYPYKSERQQRIVPYIVWKVLPDPRQLRMGLVENAVKDFFTYIRVSSAVMAETRLDRWRVRYLELRSRKYSGEKGIIAALFSHWFWAALGAVGSVASIYAAK